LIDKPIRPPIGNMILAERIVTACAAAAVVALLAAAALAHGEYAWIMEDPATQWCCGPADCRALNDGELGTDADGTWTINGYPVPDGRVYPSRDPAGRPWGCFFDPGTEQRPRCAFPGGLG
jgi:hypothetical protein